MESWDYKVPKEEAASPLKSEPLESDLHPYTSAVATEAPHLKQEGEEFYPETVKHEPSRPPYIKEEESELTISPPDEESTKRERGEEFPISEPYTDSPSPRTDTSSPLTHTSSTYTHTPPPQTHTPPSRTHTPRPHTHTPRRSRGRPRGRPRRQRSVESCPVESCPVESCPVAHGDGGAGEPDPADTPLSSPHQSDSESESDIGRDPSWAPPIQTTPLPKPKARRTPSRAPDPPKKRRKARRTPSRAPDPPKKRQTARQTPGRAPDPPKKRRRRRKMTSEEPKRRREKDKPRNALCDACGKAFISRRDLQRHVHTHTGEKPFPCPECQRRFNDRGNMRKHALVHSGARPHLCAVCGRSFSERGNLRRHETQIHGTRNGIRDPTLQKPPHVCPDCGKSYKEKGGLDRHLRAAACRDDCKVFALRSFVGNLQQSSDSS